MDPAVVCAEDFGADVQHRPPSTQGTDSCHSSSRASSPSESPPVPVAVAPGHFPAGVTSMTVADMQMAAAQLQPQTQSPQILSQAALPQQLAFAASHPPPQQLAFTASHPPPATVIYDNSIGSIGSVQYVPIQYAPVVRCYPVVMPNGQPGIMQQQYRSAGEVRVQQSVPPRAVSMNGSFGERSQPRVVSFTAGGVPANTPTPAQGNPQMRQVMCAQPMGVPATPARVLTELTPAEVRAMRKPQIQPAPPAVMGVATMVAAVPHARPRYAVSGQHCYPVRPHSGGSQGSGPMVGPVHYTSDPHGMRRHIVRHHMQHSNGSRASTMLHDSFATVSDIGEDGSPMLASLDPNHQTMAVYPASPPMSAGSQNNSFSYGQDNRATISAPNPYMVGGTKRCSNPFAAQAANPFAAMGGRQESGISCSSAQTQETALEPGSDASTSAPSGAPSRAQARAPQLSSTAAEGMAQDDPMEGPPELTDVVEEGPPKIATVQSVTFTRRDSPRALTQQPRGDSAELLMLHTRNANRAAASPQVSTSQELESTLADALVMESQLPTSVATKKVQQPHAGPLNPPHTKAPSRLCHDSSAAAREALKGAVTAPLAPALLPVSPRKGGNESEPAYVLGKNNVPKPAPRKKGGFLCFRATATLD